MMDDGYPYLFKESTSFIGQALKTLKYARTPVSPTKHPHHHLDITSQVTESATNSAYAATISKPETSNTRNKIQCFRPHVKYPFLKATQLVTPTLDKSRMWVSR